MTAREIFAELNLHYDLRGTILPDFEITDVSISAKTVSKTSIFVCLRIASHDGYAEARSAYAKGCRIFVSERALDLPRNAAVMLAAETLPLLGIIAARALRARSSRLQIFGITGTHGKSSVAQLTAALLTRAGHKTALLTDDGITACGSFIPHGFFAPNGLDMQRYLSIWEANGVEFAVIECSSYMLRNHATAGIRFSAVLLTDLAPCADDMVSYRSFDAYVAAKAMLFRDPHCPVFLPANHSCFPVEAPTVYYGKGGEVSAGQMMFSAQHTVDGTAFTLSAYGEEIDIFHPVIGDFAIHNALAAACLAIFSGLSPADVAAGLSAVKPIGRLEQIYGRNEVRIYRDVAYTGTALARCLANLRSLTAGRLLVLVGSVGGRDKHRRADLGAAASAADLIFFTADDPDAEDPAAILAEMRAGAACPAKCVLIPDRAEAIREAVAALSRGDTLLICGKAMEQTQCINGKKTPFSDVEIALSAAKSYMMG